MPNSRPDSPPSRRAHAPLAGTVARTQRAPLHAILGFAHIALGALGVFNLLALLLAAGGGMRVAGVVFVLGGLASGVSVLAGLWLVDGRRRGAQLAVAMDAVRVFLLFAAGGAGSLLFCAVVGLGIASAYVWPGLEVGPAHTPRG